MTLFGNHVGGADALVEAGYTPDMIIGDMDSVTDDVLRCGAEVIVHAYPDGRAPGLPRVNGLGVPAVTFPAAATSGGSSTIRLLSRCCRMPAASTRRTSPVWQ